MRARQRHLKPKSIGAFIALDSRYINQSDNTVVSSWNDNSGNSNNATQAVTANQPLYFTSILGGNGIVRFDGTNDFLEPPTMTKSQPYTAFVITFPRQYKFSYNLYFEDNSLGCSSYIGPSGGVQKYGIYAGVELFHGSSAALNTWFLQSGVFDSINSSVTINGSGTVTGNAGTMNVNGKFQIGRNNTAQLYLNNDTAFAMVCESAFSNSLRKKVEKSAAFSFKLACS
ncbi:MAG: hypothetical protein WCG66_03765 [bacterium]|jgi:hypothetical protein